MAASGPQNQGIPGYTMVKPLKPKPVVGPQNVGLPGYRPGDAGNPYPALAAPAPVAPAAPVAPPPPPPPDFNALTLADAQYTTQQNQINQQNTLTLEQLLKGYKGQAQGYQDNANAHGALFSGAAVNAQRSAAQSYADQQRQQALNKQGADSQNYQNVFQRLIQQLAGGN
jgi:hypothetical protein